MEGLTAARSLSHFTGDQAGAAATALRKDGVVVFDALWSPALIARLGRSLRKAVPGAYDTAAPPPEDFLGVGKLRINGLVPVAGAMRECLDLLLHPALHELCGKLLGKNWVFESFGVISSFPGATAQGLHSDSPELFEGEGPAGDLPVFALTISVPLVPVDDINGTTEFLPGTHRLPVAKPEAEDFVSCGLAPGDCMVWDFMVRHRGQANNGDAARPLLYITACRKFWQDSANFRPDARKLVLDRKAWAAIPQPQRKRFVRAKPMPGPRAAARTFIRLVRWYVPGFHRAVRQLVQRPGKPR